MKLLTFKLYQKTVPFTIPEGVTVTNKTNNNIVVNGNALNSGENITIQPEQPEPTPTPDPEPPHQTQKITIT